MPRGFLDPHDARGAPLPEVDLVQVELEDPILRHALLEREPVFREWMQRAHDLAHGESLALLDMLTGRAGAEGAAGEATAGAGSVPVALGERPAVATDLVCGMSVVTGDDALHLDHGGERYWFCGSGCLRAFAADPGAYVADAESGPGPSDT